MGEFFPYARQTAHYFERPHESVPTAPIGGEAAWRGSELASRRDDWRIVLAPDERAELIAAVARARSTGRSPEALTPADFPLPKLSARIQDWRRELDTGRGFVLVSGVPVEELSREDVELLFWCVGLHLGNPGAQNVMGDTLGHVVDTGEDAANPFVRLYRTASNIRYHCDAADVVGLLCLHPARKGGASRIVSSVSVFDELQRKRPDLAPRLFEPFLLDIRDENDKGLRALPIPPCRHAAGRLRTFYHSDYFRSVDRHDDVSIAPDDMTLMDLYESIASDPDLYLDMELAQGDMQLVSNHVVLHARTDYEDWDEPERKRHLLRLWLSI